MIPNFFVDWVRNEQLKLEEDTRLGDVIRGIKQIRNSRKENVVRTFANTD